MITVGIDPGKNGSIVIIEGDKIRKYVVPCVGTELDVHGLSDILLSVKDKSHHVFVEDVHALFGSSAGNTFEFGKVVGIIEGVLVSHKMTWTRVQPKVWQKEMFQGIPEMRKPDKTSIDKKGEPKVIKGRLDTKPMALVAAKRLFPSENLIATERSKKSHDGIVDALLIAEYGRRKLNYII